jgi:c-di-GMP-binding flagellar brake protein YcgR
MTRNTHPGAPEDNKPEHRHYPRAKVTVAVELFSDGSSMPLRVKTADLSIGGLYVEMMFTLNIGTKVKIVLWLNDLKLINSGVVATRDLQVGNGIKFTDLSAEDREKLERFLTQT